MKPRLVLIAAFDRNHLLATSRGIPWRLPADIAHFRERTQEKWLLVGRRTFDEMHGWFDQTHTPLVLSTRCGWDPPVGHIVSSVPHALALAESAGQDEVVCCGGAQTYAAALPFANKLVLTIVQHEFAADDGAAYFPKWDDAEWKIISERIHPADAENAHDFKIIELVHHRDAGH